MSKSLDERERYVKYIFISVYRALNYLNGKLSLCHVNLSPK